MSIHDTGNPVPFSIYHGDCLTRLHDLPGNSVDALVTDPPAGIDFMGREWDGDRGGRPGWVRWLAEIMASSLAALKPGAHALVWALPRRSHWTMTALEDAGFEVRDVITHVQSQGFPKGQDIGKAIDKELGAERKVVGHRKGQGNVPTDRGDWGYKSHAPVPVTDPATPEARRWDGWGSALKPAAEFWVLARKPLSEKNLARNVLKWGTGGLNLRGCKVGTDSIKRNGYGSSKATYKFFATYKSKAEYATKTVEGRHPANVVLSGDELPPWAKFFYCAKASKRERGEANTHPCVKPIELMRHLCRLIAPARGVVLDPFMGSGSTGVACLLEQRRFIGIEQDADYFAIAKARLAAAVRPSDR
jgi:DNA modification methylase